MGYSVWPTTGPPAGTATLSYLSEESKLERHTFALAFTVLLTAVIFPSSLRADDRGNLESRLRKDLQQQLLSLRQPDFGNRLQFDSLGNLLGQPHPGPWSTSGLLQVTKVHVSRDRIELDGKRALLIL